MNILKKIEKLTGNTIEPNCDGYLMIDGKFVATINGKIDLEQVAAQLLADPDFEPQDHEAIAVIDGEKGLYLMYQEFTCLLISEHGEISFN